jgi:hypothetical protein
MNCSRARMVAASSVMVAPLLLIAAFAVPAFAQQKSKSPHFAKPIDSVEYVAKSTIAELEPNGSTATASGPLTNGDAGTGVLPISTDIDFWILNVTATGIWSIGTNPGPSPAIGGTIVQLWDSSHVIAFDYLCGPGDYSLIAYNFTATGIYYVAVRSGGLFDSYPGNYELNVNGPVAPPANESCATVIAVPFVGSYSATINMDVATNDYSPPLTGCTGYDAIGGDVVYAVTLTAGQEITVEWDPVYFDASLYVVTNCADLAGTCVAGSDAGTDGDPETVTFQNTTGVITTYYIICDSYFCSGGNGTLTIQSAVADGARSWGATKALYR